MHGRDHSQRRRRAFLRTDGVQVGADEHGRAGSGIPATEQVAGGVHLGFQTDSPIQEATTSYAASSSGDHATRVTPPRASPPIRASSSMLAVTERAIKGSLVIPNTETPTL